MGFYESICKIIGGNGLMPVPYRITMLSSYGAYVEGAVKVLDVTSSKIIIQVKSAKLVFEGKNLSIGSYSEKDVTILGDIIKLEKSR